ncbi:MAG TPA: endonuclease Q family protein [Thermoplasmata archaeon]|nr:endonuclease Q family protein [Thermoplasmata archaeon]
MPVDCDLHVHGRYSIGVSASLDFPSLAAAARRKGLGLLGTGDILHPIWREEFGKVAVEKEDGVYEVAVLPGGSPIGAGPSGTAASSSSSSSSVRFVASTEVESKGRIHHLILLESLEAADKLAAALRPHSSLRSDGRPRVKLEGEALARLVVENGGLIGPAHAFTPWTSLFGSKESLDGCYGAMTDSVSFLELGLSADSSYADRISSLHPLVFLTGSDAHSAHPAKFGREFTRMDLREEGFEGLRRALRRNSDRILLNVGVPPEHGKYNRTACTRCYEQYERADADSRKWKCPCGGRIKVGVRDRVAALGDLPEGKHPAHRPPYRRMLPLAELAGLALKKGPATKAVAAKCDALISRFGNDIAVLLDAGLREIGEVAGEGVARAVELARAEKLVIDPGGGGNYGRARLP